MDIGQKHYKAETFNMRHAPGEIPDSQKSSQETGQLTRRKKAGLDLFDGPTPLELHLIFHTDSRMILQAFKKYHQKLLNDCIRWRYVDYGRHMKVRIHHA